MSSVALLLLVALTILYDVTCTNKGEILLGGLVPIHSKCSASSDCECGALHSRLGVQRLEAVLFAVDQINSNSKILPNITLGIQVYDTCSSETEALDKAVNFISGRLSSSSKAPPVVGVIGASYSSVSIQIAHLLRLFEIPQISFDSTSVELSDKKKFKYFSRTVPHDGFQAKAIVDVARSFNWTYISAVYSDDTYGIHGMEALRKESKRAGLCIATAQMIKVSKDGKSLDVFLKIIHKIVSEPLAKTVVVFTSQESHIRSLLKAAKEHNVNHKIQWVGSDAWGNIVWLKELQHLADNAITVSPKSVRLKDFENYFINLTPEKNSRNPWFREYWQTHFKCSINSTVQKTVKYPIICNDSLRLTPSNSNIDMRVASAIDAVNAFAHALNDMHADLCSGSVGLCDEMSNISGSSLLEYLRNVSFLGSTGFKVEFDHHGDVEGIYDIMHFKKHGDTYYKNTVIGQWAGKLSLQKETGFQVVTSSCNRQCSSNQVVVPVKGKESCCTECIECSGNKYVLNRTTCVQCPPGYWPMSDNKGCSQIKVMYFGINLMYSIPTIILSGIGVITTIFVIIMLARNDQTPIVKASGREMAYLILVGILISFLHTFIVVIKPSDIVCVVRFFTCSIAFSICYAAIFIKTNRISRIFNRRNIARRPILILPTSQLVLVMGVVCIQVLFLLMLALLRTPKATTFYPTVSNVYIECAVNDLDFGLSQVYNFALILVCTLYAFKTRKIPSNFNEAKFIAFAMYCTCVIWLAFLAIYFMRPSSMERSLILCISVSLVAYVLLGTLFGPKIYILLFKPHRNVRKPVTSLSLSSINQANRCPKCAYVGVNLSVERDSDQAQNSSADDPIEGNSSNRMALLEHNRPISLYGQDGLLKPDVEKVINFMRRELQATKYALRTANEKLRQKEKDECNDEELIDRKRAKALKEVKGENSEKNSCKNSACVKTCYPLCNETTYSQDDTNHQIMEMSKSSSPGHDVELDQPCNVCTNEKWTTANKLASLCPGCKKAFQMDPLYPWRKSYSLSDIESRLDTIVNKQKKRDIALGNTPDLGSTEDQESCASTLLEPWDSLLIPKGTML